MRRVGQKSRSVYDLLSFGLFASLFILVCFTFMDYGIGWDEFYHLNNGNYLIEFYTRHLSGEPTWAEKQEEIIVRYGGFYDLIAALVRRAILVSTAVGEVEINHLVNALFGVFGIVGTWAAARRLAGVKAGWWAALFLALTPVYYGHMFINPKDVPFAVANIWAIYCLLGVLRDFPVVRWPSLARFGLAAGIAMAIRVNGVCLLGYFTIFLVWNTARSLVTPRNDPRRVIWKNFALPVTTVSLGAYVLMLIFWPWAQTQPLLHPWQALQHFSHFPWALWVRFGGLFFRGDKLPADYVLRWLAISLPEIILVGLSGLFFLVSKRWKYRCRSVDAIFLIQGLGLFLIATFLPVMFFMLMHPSLYDGIRQLLFILPPLTCLAGIGFVELIEWSGNRIINGQRVALISAILFVMMHLVIVAQLHPYEYIYFNRFVGGIAGAYMNYETEYWGTATSEGARWLGNYLTQDGNIAYPEASVITCSSAFSSSYYLPPTIKMTQWLNDADYFIGSIRWYCSDQISGKILFTVARDGVPLAVVKDLRTPRE